MPSTGLTPKSIADERAPGRILECLLHQGTRKVSHRSPREARDLISLRDFWAKACLQSAACKEAGDEIEKAGKTGIGLFVASCDAAECLEGTEEVLDQM